MCSAPPPPRTDLELTDVKVRDFADINNEHTLMLCNKEQLRLQYADLEIIPTLLRTQTNIRAIDMFDSCLSLIPAINTTLRFLKRMKKYFFFLKELY